MRCLHLQKRAGVAPDAPGNAGANRWRNRAAVVSDRASVHAADASGDDEPRPSAAALVGVLHDARRPLIGKSTGGLSTAQLRMVRSALDIAGRQFVPSADQLWTKCSCSGCCGDAAAPDSLLSSAVRALEDDVSRSAPNAADAACVFVQRSFQWHACNGGCASGLRAGTMRHPLPQGQFG